MRKYPTTTTRTITQPRKRKPEPILIAVELLRCSMHNFAAIQIGDTIVTPTNCCGSWAVERRWKIDPRYLVEWIALAPRVVSPAAKRGLQVAKDLLRKHYGELQRFTGMDTNAKLLRDQERADLLDAIGWIAHQEKIDENRRRPRK